MANCNIWRVGRGTDNAELNNAYMKISLTDLECYEMLWNVCQFTGFRLSESIVQKSDPAHVMTSSTGNPNLNFFSLFCCCYCCCCCCCCWYWCWWCYCCCFCCCYVFVCDDFCCCCVVVDVVLLFYLVWQWLTHFWCSLVIDSSPNLFYDFTFLNIFDW